jgi:hypothetical protein
MSWVTFEIQSLWAQVQTHPIYKKVMRRRTTKKLPSPYQLSEEAPVGFSFAFQKQVSFTKFYKAFNLHINFI